MAEKVDGKTGASPKIPSARRSAAPTAVKKPRAGFSTHDAEDKQADGRADAPSVTAPLSTLAPDALWSHGGAGGRREQFLALSPVERQAKVQELEAHKAELEVRIEDRARHLAGRWRHKGVGARAQLLERFCSNECLSPAGRSPVRGAQSSDEAVVLGAQLQNLERANHRMADLQQRAKAKALRKGEPGAAGTRSELARQLVEARKDQKQAVHSAEKVIAQEGLTVDLLAQSEQVLAPGQSRALLELLSDWSMLWSELGVLLGWQLSFTSETTDERRDRIRREEQRDHDRHGKARHSRQAQARLELKALKRKLLDGS